MLDRLLLASVATLLLACGSTVQDDAASAAAAGGTGGSTSEGATTASSASATSASSSSAGGGPQDCDALSNAFTDRLGDVPPCATVIRLDHDSLAVLGYVVVCGSHQLDKAQALARAQADGAVTGTSISGDHPDDAFVFYEPAGDFGGSSVVSPTIGETLFAGTTVWDGGGDIVYPTSWGPASDLGSCDAPALNIQARGFQLGSGNPLPDAEVKTALDAALHTALSLAIEKVTYPKNALVLAYPRGVGGVDTKTEEYVVVVNTIWLE